MDLPRGDAEPGVIVLHDVVLHHLIVEMTLARGDVDGYVAALRASHGEAGEAWARGRAAGLHSEMGNFLLPASIEVAQPLARGDRAQPLGGGAAAVVRRDDADARRAASVRARRHAGDA